jgi:hypothetical protein
LGVVKIFRFLERRRETRVVGKGYQCAASSSTRIT